MEEFAYVFTPPAGGGLIISLYWNSRYNVTSFEAAMEYVCTESTQVISHHQHSFPHVWYTGNDVSFCVCEYTSSVTALELA